MEFGEPLTTADVTTADGEREYGGCEYGGCDPKPYLNPYPKPY